MRLYGKCSLIVLICLFLAQTSSFGQSSQLSVQKLVDKSRAQLGDVLTYTVTLTNSGTATATNIIVDEMVTAKAVFVPGSISLTTGSFTTGFPSHTWAISSLPASATASLVFSVSIISEGIIYNSAIIPNVDTAQICTTVPFKVCAGSNYAVLVSAPAGYTNYKFYNGSTLVQDGALNSYTAVTAGEYSVIVDNLPGVCSDASCCPIVIEEVPIPSLTLTSGSGLTVGAGSSLTLTASGCSSGTVVWPGSLTGTSALSRVVSPTATSTYSASCISSAGCTTVAAVTIQTVVPQLTILKQVDKKKAQIGDSLRYVVTLINNTPYQANNVIVYDSTSNVDWFIPGSVTVSAGTYTVLMLPVTEWTIPSVPANSTVTVAYAFSAAEPGIIYSKARVAGSESTVCTSIPFKVCPGDSIELVLNAPTGYTRYEWYNGTTLLYNGTSNTYSATAVGEYRVMAFNGSGQCQDVTCCPIIIEEDPFPSFVVVAKTPTCVGNQPQGNGTLTIQGLGADPTKYRFRYSEGTSFDLTLGTPTDPATVPADGVIVSTLNENKTYTVRVYNQSGCYRDFTVTMTINCNCSREICVPIAIRRLSSR